MDISFSLLIDITAAVLTSLFIGKLIAVNYLQLNEVIGTKLQAKRSLLNQKINYASAHAA